MADKTYNVTFGGKTELQITTVFFDIDLIKFF